jgi:hypothetical protein
MQQRALPNVHMFWHGPPLSRIERLCMSSFVAHGHAVQLHVYEEPKRVPTGVTIRDAAAVLPREELFVHRSSGSLAVFADWFRYRLLAEHGGLWVDTDVVCLRPFDHAGPEIFGWQDQSTINNAVLGLPQDHALARWMVACCEQPNRFLPYDTLRMRRRKLVRRLLRRGRAASRWGETGPAGLTAAARHLGCASTVLALLSDPLSELAQRVRHDTARAHQSRGRQLWIASVERNDAPAAGLRPQRALSARLAVRATVGALRHQR